MGEKYIKKSYGVKFCIVAEESRAVDLGEPLTKYKTKCGRPIWDFDVSENITVTGKKPHAICDKCLSDSPTSDKDKEKK